MILVEQSNKYLQIYVNGFNGWIRLRKDHTLLIRWNTNPPLFSERKGYKVPKLRIGKFRLFVEDERAKLP